MSFCHQKPLLDTCPPPFRNRSYHRIEAFDAWKEAASI